MFTPSLKVSGNSLRPKNSPFSGASTRLAPKYGPDRSSVSTERLPVRTQPYNRLFPSCLHHYKSEARCKVFVMKISFHSYANKTNFYMKSFTLSFAFYNEVHSNSEMAYSSYCFIGSGFGGKQGSIKRILAHQSLHVNLSSTVVYSKHESSLRQDPTLIFRYFLLVFMFSGCYSPIFNFIV